MQSNYLYPTALTFREIQLICWSKIFRFTVQNINAWATQFNRQHGGLNPNVFNVLFINGDNDPYRELNVRAPLNDRTKVINLPGNKL